MCTLTIKFFSKNDITKTLRNMLLKNQRSDNYVNIEKINKNCENLSNCYKIFNLLYLE